MVKYTEWIMTNVPYNCYGQCRERVTEMQKIFNELTAVRGHYYCPVWGKREHWWLVDKDNEIIDPTAMQFPSKGLGIYEPFKEGSAEPTGICMNCGEYCYEGRSSACSEVCDAEIKEYYGI